MFTKTALVALALALPLVLSFQPQAAAQAELEPSPMSPPHRDLRELNIELNAGSLEIQPSLMLTSEQEAAWKHLAMTKRGSPEACQALRPACDPALSPPPPPVYGATPLPFPAPPRWCEPWRIYCGPGSIGQHRLQENDIIIRDSRTIDSWRGMGESLGGWMLILP